MNENKVAAASYILTFYQEAHTLLHNFSLYVNIMAELKTKYSDDFKNMTSEERQFMLQISQQVRYSVNKVYIQFIALHKPLKLPYKDDISLLHTKINQNFVMSQDDLGIYCQKIHQALVESVIKDLLETSDEYVKQLYNDNT